MFFAKSIHPVTLCQNNISIVIVRMLLCCLFIILQYFHSKNLQKICDQHISLITLISLEATVCSNDCDSFFTIKFQKFRLVFINLGNIIGFFLLNSLKTLIRLQLAQTYSETCQISKMELFTKILTRFQLSTIFEKNFFIYVSECSEYASDRS